MFLPQKISFKSYNGGRVDSEQEDSPRSLNTTTLTSLNNLRCLNNSAQHHAPSPLPPSNNNKDTLRRVDYSGNEYTSNELVVTPAANIIDPSKVILAADIDYGRAEQLGTLTRAQQAERAPAHLLPHLLHHQIAAQHHYLTHAGRRKQVGVAGGGYLRSASPWNHTYTEIRDGLGQLHQIRAGRPPSEDDPVYEEIERNNQEVQVSDMSDEDGRRQSDMSRQSSRSYSDHRPLIPYGQAAAAAANLPAAVTLESLLRHNLKEQQQLDAELMRYRAAGVLRQAAVDANVRTVAFLEGETVVCHLQPEAAADLYNPYAGARTMVLSPYSEC